MTENCVEIIELRRIANGPEAGSYLLALTFHDGDVVHQVMPEMSGLEELKSDLHSLIEKIDKVSFTT